MTREERELLRNYYVKWPADDPERASRSDVVALLDALDAAEARAEKAERERDEATKMLGWAVIVAGGEVRIPVTFALLRAPMIERLDVVGANGVPECRLRSTLTGKGNR